MPELRRDPIIGRWVIIATERQKRPYDFIIEKDKTKGGFCPLCPGNENTTPPEVLAYGRPNHHPNGPNWQIRVVPNKFPALRIEGELDKRGEGIYDKMNGIGAHEVIIESPDHHATFISMPLEQLSLVFKAYKERIIDLSRDIRFKYVIVFKNFGQAAGASLEHSHSQLIALPIVPQIIQEELDGCIRYFKYKDRCVFCDIIRQEQTQKIRIIHENEEFIALSPFAPRAPFEMWVLPKIHQSHFTALDSEKIYYLSEMFSNILKRLDTILPNCPYNFMVHTAPLREKELEYFHWHIEIMPKVQTIAGFEWGTGFHINTVSPEEATKMLTQETNIEN